MNDPLTEKTIFEAALKKRASAERLAYLDEVCGHDAALRQRIEALLQAQETAVTAAEPLAEDVAPEHGRTEVAPSTPPEEDAPGLVHTTARETQAHRPADDDQALDFLEPSAEPGVLGRLGHYEVMALVGRGGMGVVLRAFDAKLHRVVAIKTMGLELAASATARKRFTREAQAAAAVCHDHVVTIHAVEEDHRPPYLVMQYVEGCSLQDKLNRAGPLPLREILRIGMQTAAGLAAAHKQGLVHRDIKPANILLENSVERVKITDFGLARATDDASLTQSGVIAGTPQYMSPEQAEAKPVDRRSDLFSLGSVLYALCTGRAPFRANSTMAVLRRVCEDNPRPIREVNPDIPDWLCDIIAKLHSKKPAGRFQSAGEVAELLGECLARLQQGTPIAASPARQGQTPPAPIQTSNAAASRSRRLALAVMCGSFLAAVCLFGFGLWLLTRGSSQGLPWDPKPTPPAHSSPTAEGGLNKAPDVNADLLADALLVMDFEKDAFYEKDGKTYVRDRSSHGNDGLCEKVAFTPEGKAGGGLACDGGYLRLKGSLINRLPNYTLTAWLRVENAEGRDRWIYVRAMEQLKESNYHVWTDGGGGLGVNAWNHDHRPDYWIGASPNQSAIAKGQWVFVAAVLRNGSASKGDLRLVVDDRVYNLKSQMVDGDDEGFFDYLGVGLKAVLDEVTVFPRALTDAEIQAIRQRGLEGRPLGATALPSP